MRYKVWRSNKDKLIHVIARAGAFDELPDAIRHLGPWVGSYEGDVERLRPHYRAALIEQDFIVVYKHVKDFRAEVK